MSAPRAPDIHAESDRVEFSLTIDGAAVETVQTFGVVNPSTALVFARCPNATRVELDRAITAARRAFPAWADAGWDARAQALRRFASVLRENAAALANLLTREQGKPLAESRSEIGRAADLFEVFSRQRVRSNVLRDDDRERIEEHFHAAGVAGIISPWNVPVTLFALRAAPMLQTGSTVVAKPSPYTPLTMLRVGELSRDIFPPGVLNVIAGQDPLGQWMTEHPGVDRISFTGSVQTGKRVMSSCAQTLKRISLELGGNDAAIVLDDVDVEETAARLLSFALRNCGQICMAVKRIYAHRSIYEALVQALASRVATMAVGDGFEEGVQLGPLQNRAQFDAVNSLLEETVRIPGVRVFSGQRPKASAGYFIAPTLVADIPDDARLVRAEQFGPVIPVLAFDDVEDAVRRANDTGYGLSASVWSSDIERASAVAARLHAGTVWVNQHMELDPDTPFGGWKESGLGRGNGVIGLQSCMEPNVIRVLKS